MFRLVVLLYVVVPAFARIHQLDLKNDGRRYYTISTFGFYQNGVLDVDVTTFQFYPFNDSGVFGFSLEKTITDGSAPYVEDRQDRCVLEDGKRRDNDDSSTDGGAFVFFTFDLRRHVMLVNCSSQLGELRIYRNHSAAAADRAQHFWSEHSGPRNEREATYLITGLRTKRDVRREQKPENQDTSKTNKKPSDQTAGTEDKGKLPTEPDHPDSKHTAVTPTAQRIADSHHEVPDSRHGTAQDSTAAPPVSEPTAPHKPAAPHTAPATKQGSICNVAGIPILEEMREGARVYRITFSVAITSPKEEGLYNLYFHSCPNYHYGTEQSYVNLSVTITESNDGNYLSAGEMPLPALYFTMFLLFFLSGCFWIFILRNSSSGDVFRIHYLMAVLVFMKSLSLLFHSINFHFIQIRGIHVEGWAVLDYITHLLRGALLFITIILIGTGWAFIKHILSDKDKKIFMIVIPLQVLANIAQIIMEESEEGESSYWTWREVFYLVDLLCCGAILFPVVWSIRHLQDASSTDGKAVISLRKLKLFRHFYIMIVCYIYFSRIIVYLLKITVPFQYEWMNELCREMATFVFFVLTGYKFRPASNNPYFQLPQEDMELTMDQVVTQSGAYDRVSKVKRMREIIEDDDDEDTQFIRKESSHEYD